MGFTASICEAMTDIIIRASSGAISHYWFILTSFAIVAYFVKDTNYFSMGIGTVLGNYIGYQCNWSYEAWFLLPYSLLSLSSPFLFKQMDRIRSRYVVVGALACYLCAATIISKFHATLLADNPLLSLGVVYFEFLGSFGWGAIARKEKWFEKASAWYAGKSEWHYPSALLVLLIGAKCAVPSAAWGTIYTLAFIFLFYLCARPSWLDKALAELGKHSMNMWLIHTWYSNYLFHDFIFSFKYPLFIYLVLIVASYATSHLVNAVCGRISVSWADKK